MALNDLFWVPYFRKVLCGEVRLLTETLRARVLPNFSNIDQEADQLAQAEYERIGSLPGGENFDMAQAAESANMAGIIHYEQMMGMRQGIINVFAVFLYHLFEQQLLSFHRRQVLNRIEEDNPKLIHIGVLIERLIAISIDITRFPSWGKIEELRIVANTVKHAEGESAEKLRKLKPELFLPVTSFSYDEKRKGKVYKPLMGEDIYLTDKDIECYASAIEQFWLELAEAVP